MGDSFEDLPEMVAGAEAAYASYLARVRRGEEVDFDAFCAERSHLASALQRLHEVWSESSRPPPAKSRLQSIREFLDERGESEPADARNADSSVQERLRQLATRTGRYTLRGEVARGGMGVILKVWDRDLRRTLAMKTSFSNVEGLSEGEAPSIEVEQVSRFLEEAQITGQLEHPGVVPVHELGVDDEGRMFFTMQLVRGRTFDDIIKLARDEEEGWNRVRALGVLVRVCEAMAYAHSKGVIHRDLKPANIMIGKFGEVYVMDWGLAKVIGRPDRSAAQLDPAQSQLLIRTDRVELQSGPDSALQTMEGTIVGTPAFMPPEQAEGRVDELDPRADVYATGALLYSLATGWMPYVDPENPARAGQVLQALIGGPPKPILEIDGNVPPELIAICEKAMARRPADRYPNMLAMADDLRAFLERRVVKAYQTGAFAEFRKWVVRNKATAASLAAFVLLAIGAAVFVAWREARQSGILRSARDDTEYARARAEANADRATANARSARANAARAERQTYLASLAAAHASLRMNETLEAKQLLAACSEALRGWEWRHLQLRTDTSQSVLRGHAGKVTAIALSPDGSRVVSGSDDGTVRVWNRESGEELFRLPGTPAAISALAFSPDGTRLAAAAKDMLVHVWDPQAARLLGTLGGHESAVTCVAFSADGARLVTGADEGVRTWDVAGLRPLGAIAVDQPVLAAAFVPGDAGIAAVVESGALFFGTDGAPGRTVEFEAATCLAFDAEGKHVAIGGRTGRVRLVDVASGKALRTLAGHTDPLTGVLFVGDRLLTASYDKTVRVWDVGRGATVAVLRGHDDAVLAVDARDDSVVTASADQTVRLWSLRDGGAVRVLQSEDPFLNAVAFGPRGSVVAGAGQGGLQLWDVASGDPVRALADEAGGVSSVAFAAAASWLVAGGEEDATARIFDRDSGALRRALTGHEASVTAVAVSPDASLVATGAADRSVRLWDAATGKERRALAGHADRVSAVAFSPDGALLATASFDGTVRLWDVASGEQRRLLEGHDGRVLDVVFAPDGRRVVSAGADRSIRFWDVGDGEPGAILWGHASAVSALAFDEEGTRLVSGGHDKTVRLWDVATGELLLRLRAHDEWVTDVAFAGDRIASCAYDATIRIWRATDRAAR